MKTTTRLLVYAAASLITCLLASCAGSMDTAALVPTNASASSRTGLPVVANVSGGTPSSQILATISNEAYKKALETSLVKSGLFRNTGSGGYQLDAFIVAIKQPIVGISMKVEMTVSYTLKKGGSIVWSKNLTSSYSAPLGEALVGAVRVRKATEGAVRENCALLIRSLDEKL